MPTSFIPETQETSFSEESSFRPEAPSTSFVPEGMAPDDIFAKIGRFFKVRPPETTWESPLVAPRRGETIPLTQPKEPIEFAAKWEVPPTTPEMTRAERNLLGLQALWAGALKSVPFSHKLVKTTIPEEYTWQPKVGAAAEKLAELYTGQKLLTGVAGAAARVLPRIPFISPAAQEMARIGTAATVRSVPTFTTQSLLSEASRQAEAGEFKPKELAKAGLTGAAWGTAFSALGFIPEAIPRVITAFGIGAGLPATEALITKGKIEPEDWLNIGLNAAILGGLEILGAKTTTRLRQEAMNTAWQNERAIVKLMGKGMTEKGAKKLIEQQELVRLVLRENLLKIKAENPDMTALQQRQWNKSWISVNKPVIGEATPSFYGEFKKTVSPEKYEEILSKVSEKITPKVPIPKPEPMGELPQLILGPQPEAPPAKVIPPELEPLAQEARKYMSAEEFVDSVSDAYKMRGTPIEKTALEMEVQKFIYQRETPKRIKISDLTFNEKQLMKELKPIPGKTIDIPVIVEKGVLRDGHHRVAQAIANGEDTILVFERKSLEQTKSQLTDFYNQAVGAGYLTEKMRPAPSEALEPSKLVPLSEGKQAKIIRDAPPVEIPPPTPLPPVPEDTAVPKVIAALAKAKSVRGQQEKIYSQERAERLARAEAVGEKVAGERGFFEELGQLRGEMDKVEFESIRNALTQTDIDNLFIKVKNSPLLSAWEKISARTGLAKLLGQFGGQVPTEGELAFLDRVFGEKFTSAVMNKRPLLEKFQEAIEQTFNIPRSIMSSFDLSFGLRQGAFAAPAFRKQFIASWLEQFKMFGRIPSALRKFLEKRGVKVPAEWEGEEAYRAVMESIAKDPFYELAVESGVSFTDIGRVTSLREERFQSQWAEKIPFIGMGIRASGRAYTGFANKFRMDIFSSMAKDAETLGLNPRENPDLTKQIADFVNNATGRGSLGAFARSSRILNAFFFSPRLLVSRLTLLNPAYYIRQKPFVRKQALKSLLAFLGVGFTILTLAKLAGAKVGIDLRSADFGKIVVGKTRLDIWAGFQQYVKLAAQLVTGQYVSSVTGKLVTLGEGYRPLTRKDILLRFIESKEAPVFSFANMLLAGQTQMGRPINLFSETAQRFTPMVIGDMIDIARTDPSLLPISSLGIFGMGLQTYVPEKKIRYPKQPQRRVKWLL